MLGAVSRLQRDGGRRGPPLWELRSKSVDHKPHLGALGVSCRVPEQPWPEGIGAL